jgi:hypothetical protein
MSDRRTIASRELDWRTGDNKFTLHFRGSKALLCVIPDAVHPNMWRISCAGRLSDMVNLARAKDAALTWALGDLNRDQDSPSHPTCVLMRWMGGGVKMPPLMGALHESSTRPR